MAEGLSIHPRHHLSVFLLWLLLVSLLCVSLFKHISYPLFWNDEGDTVVLAARTLKYGYPLVDDGRNELYLTQIDRAIGIHASSGALLYGGSWLKFYLGAIGVWLAERTDDLYLKTGIIRTEFALFGLAGLAILAIALVRLYHKRSFEQYRFLLLFTFFELLSVPLVLHLREVRHYSLLVALLSLVLYVHVHSRITGRISPRTAGFCLIPLLWLLCNTFFPVYVICVATLAFFEVLEAFRNRREGRSGAWRDLRRTTLVLAISFATILPVLWFFRTMELSAALSREYQFGWGLFQHNLEFIFTYLTRYEFFYLALSAHLIARRWRQTAREDLDQDGVLSRAADLLIIFIALHVLLIARSPIMFQRYLIALQPIMVGLLALDINTICQRLARRNPFADRRERWSALVNAALLFLVFVFSVAQMIGPLQGHMYSLLHRYRGPLDYVVPFLKKAFPNAEDLIIATNYEEPCYIYYLGSRVVVGYHHPNLERDHALVPDVIIYRRYWHHSPEIFAPFLRKARYYAVRFPVFDYKVNNIPDLQFSLHHLFVTPRPEKPEEALTILIRDIHHIPGIWPTGADRAPIEEEKHP